MECFKRDLFHIAPVKMLCYWLYWINSGQADCLTLYFKTQIISRLFKIQAFNNMTLATRRALCAVMEYAVIDDVDEIVMANGEKLDSWSVILNGEVEVARPDGTLQVYRSGERCVCLGFSIDFQVKFFLTYISIAYKMNDLVCVQDKLTTSIMFYVEHYHNHLFWKRPFLPRYTRVRRLPILSPSTNPWILPIQDANQALPCPHPHTSSKSSFSSHYVSHPPQ